MLRVERKTMTSTASAVRLPHLLARCLPLALPLLAAAAFAGDRSPPQIAPAEKTESAGLFNDFLRERSPAFEQWDIGGQFRFRFEMKDDAGLFPNTDFIRRGVKNDNDYFLFREKIHIGWEPAPWLKIYAQGRGAQAVSDDRSPSPDQDSFDLHQAYIRLGDPASSRLSLKVGRQELTYGDQRMIGLGDWGNAGRSFDAAVLHFSPTKKTWIDLFASRVVIPRDEYLNESNDYDQFSGVYASSQELWRGVETQAYFLARNVGAGSPSAITPNLGGPSERDVYTYGLRLKSLAEAFGSWDFTFEGAGQFGEVVTGGIDRELHAFFFTGTVGYTFKDAWGKPRIGVGYDYASGDSDANDREQETFDPLFATNHGFYGVMDIIGPRNLSSPRISISAKPTKKLTVSLDYLLFWLADSADSFYPESGPARAGNGYGRNPQFGSFVGSELDIVAKYAVTNSAELQVGYGHFFAGDYIKSSVGSVPANGGATDADWFYVQATINF